MEAEVGGVIVARLDSRRLPGKVLRAVSGKPLLYYVVSRCRQVLSSNIVVATSDRPVDDPIASYCQEQGIGVFRGAAENVAGRVAKCVADREWEYFFRINADSPFFDPPLAARAKDIAATGEYDLITNLNPRSFPYGVSVELLKSSSFRAAEKHMCLPEHFEHVTLFLYRNIERFKYYNILRDGDDLSHVRLTVDTMDDLRKFESIIKTFEGRWTSLSYGDVLPFLK